MTTTDQELLERWVTRHDAEAFKDLTARYAGMVYATCRRILGNDTDAEDVTQECFMTLAREGQTPASYLGPWLHRVATNRSLNWIRSETRRKKREQNQDDIINSVVTESAREILSLVDEAIANLPEKQRIPVVAYFFENQTHEAIAENLGLTRQGAAYRVRSGIDAVRKSLKRQGVMTGATAVSALLVDHATASVPEPLSAELGKLALRGPIAPENATIAWHPVATVIALKSKVIIATALLILTVVAGIFFRGQTPPTSPIPSPVLVSDTQSDDSERTISDSQRPETIASNQNRKSVV